MIDFAQIQAAHQAIGGAVRRTPTLHLAPTRREPAHDVWLKLENLQVTGSFKPRGATHVAALMPAEQRKRGIVTASGGNFGLGAAYAGLRLSVPVTVFVSRRANAARLARLNQWGARVAVAGEEWEDAWTAATEHAEASGETLLHPFDDPRVIAGAGTAALELLEDAPALDAVVVGVGGGSLLAGTAIVVGHMSPATRVIGVEPAGAASMRAAFDHGRPVRLPQVQTIADTLAPACAGIHTFAACRGRVETIDTVTDAEMVSAMRLLWDSCDLLVEPAGAAALARVVRGLPGLGKTARVAVIISGGNVNAESALTQFDQTVAAAAMPAHSAPAPN